MRNDEDGPRTGGNGFRPQAVARQQEENVLARLAGGETPEMVLQYIKGIQFPAKKDDIVNAARQNGAPHPIVGALSQLPVGEFGSPEELIDAYPQLGG